MRLCSSLCRTANPSTLLGVYEHIPLCPRCNLSYLDYVDWKKLNKVFASLEIYHNNGYILTTPTGVEPARAGSASAPDSSVRWALLPRLAAISMPARTGLERLTR